jgi:hypothetical protein
MLITLLNSSCRYNIIVLHLIIKTNKDMKIVKTMTRNNKTISIARVVKPGTTRVFFFPVTSDNKRLNTTLYARQYDAEGLAKAYLTSIN